MHHAAEQFRRRFWVCLALTVPAIALSRGLPLRPAESRLIAVPGADWILLALSIVLYLYGGWPFLTGFVAEVRERAIGMMTLIAVATTVAFGYSAGTVLGLPGTPLFLELATLIDVMLLGHWIEMRSVGEASLALESLAELMPAQAHVRDAAGATTDVPLEELSRGDIVVIRPGEKVPADGDVLEGETAVDESLLTGESVPVAKHAGDRVIGGSINAEGALVVSVTGTGADSFVAQVAELVREAQQSKSRAQDLADRAARWLTFVALGGGAVTLAAWLALGRPFAFALERAVTVMVIACPHALGLAVPLVVAISTALGARSGVLVRDRAAFETARRIDIAVFDKTGTLTLGQFGVDEVVALGVLDEHEVLSLAASIEQFSEHPVARALTAAGAGGRAVEDFRAVPGVGAFGTVDGHQIAVVSPAYVRDMGIALPSNAEGADSHMAAGRTSVVVLRDRLPEGVIWLSDIVRPESAAAMERLRAMGIETVMLTGDNAEVAARVAGDLGIERYFADVLPAAKADIVRALRAEDRVVAMVGDGVNDAPSLATADVGIAIGAGTDVAVATADIVLVKSDPRDVAEAIALARATYAKMRQNLAWATGYNVIAIPLAAGVLAGLGVLLSPAVGAALMSASTVIVAANARTLRVR